VAIFVEPAFVQPTAVWASKAYFLDAVA